MSDQLIHQLASLSAQQVRLLRLVKGGKTASKELARETGLQPASIDTYLQSAARTLGVRTRGEAAALLQRLEEESSQSPSQLRGRRLVERLKTGLSRYASWVWRFATDLPIGGREHGYSWRRIVVETFRVALIAIALVTALVLIVRGWMRTFG